MVIFIDVNVRLLVRVVVIIGFNIGGKIVILKILGLVAVMVKVGLFIFVNDFVKLFWFE